MEEKLLKETIMKKLSHNFQEGSYYCSECGFVVHEEHLDECPHCHRQIKEYENES